MTRFPCRIHSKRWRGQIHDIPGVGACGSRLGRQLLMDLDTPCNASLMPLGGEGWEKASRAGRTIADYFYDRFDEVAGDLSTYVVNNVSDAAHARTARGPVSLFPGSQRLEDIQGASSTSKPRSISPRLRAGAKLGSIAKGQL
jgi:hypothetical protein